jgi:cell division septation protein DedD
MTIDKKKLVELLVDKTSMNKEEVEAQLDQLIERILDAAKRGKALEIKEFGVFYFDEEGELRFDAAEELSTEISFKYAGMKPVELKPERDTTISDVEEEADEDEGEEFDEDPFATSYEDSVFEEDQAEESDVEPEEETKPRLDEEEEFPFDFEDESDEEKDSEESIITDPFSSEALEPLEEPVETEEERTKIQDIKPVSRTPVKKKDNTGVFILIAIVVIAVLIGGYFYYVSTQSEPSTELSQSTETQMQSGMDEGDDSEMAQTNPDNSQMIDRGTTNQQSAGNNQVSSEQGGANQGTEEEIVSSNGVAASQTDQDLYGLRGSVIEEANDGYSIVLHSFRAEENAMQASNQLQSDGYRVIVTSRTVYENLVWRVSVGQFESLGAAQQATTQLPEPYSTQNFIQRIRIN